MAISAQRLQVDVVANTGKAKAELNELQQFSAKASKGMKGMVAKAAAGLGGAAIVGGLAKSINLAKDFDLTIRQVGVQTGQTGKGLKDLSGLAIKMGKDTAFSAQDASGAMLELAKGGLSAADIKAGALKTTMTLAAAGGLEMASAAEYVTQSMNTFGIAAKNADQVAVALAGGANASTASVESLGMALSQVGPGATNAGMSLQETVAALAAFDNNGIKGSDAGTSLKTMLSRLVPQTDAAASAMRKYGLSFVKPNGEFKSMSQVAGQLRKGLGKLSDEERTAALNTLFGADASRAATVMMKEGEKGIQGYIKATKNQKTVQDMANTAMGGAKGAWEELTGTVETLAIQVGTAALPAFTAAAKGAADMVDGIAGSGPKVMAAFGWAKGFVDGFLTPFKPALEPLKGLLDGAAGGATSLGDALAPVGRFIADNERALGIISGVIFTVFIPALVAAGTAAVIAKVKVVAGFVAQGLAAVRSAAMVSVALAQNIVFYAHYAALVVADLARVAAAWVASTARIIAAGAMHMALLVRMAVAQAIHTAGAVAGYILLGVAAVASWATQGAAAVAGAARVVAAWVLMGTQAMIQAGRMAAAWFIALGPIGWVIAAVAAIAVAVYLNWDKIVAFTKAAWARVRGALAAAWGGIKAGAAAALGFLKNLFLNFTGPGLIIKHWARIKAATSSAWNAVRNFVSSAMSSVRNAVSNAASSARSAMQSAWNAIVNAVSSAIGRLMGHVSGIRGRITGAFAGAAGWLSGVGGQIIDGLVGGLQAGFARVKSVLGSLTGMIPDWKGPAKKDKKLLVDAGKKIIGGLVKGLTSSYKDVKKTLGELTVHIKKAMSGKTENAWLKRVAQANKKFKKLYEHRASIAKRLEAKIAKRDDLRQQKEEFKSSVVSGISSQANVLNAGADAKTIRASLQTQLAKAKEYAANLKKMKSMGYSKAVVQQVASAGIEQGAEVAKALVAANVADMKGINSAFKGINTVAEKTGASLAGGYYDAGIQAANGLIKGMQAKDKELEAQAKRMAKTLTKALKKELGIKSPSKVTDRDGVNVALGLIRGTQREMSAIARQGALLGSTLTGGLSRALKGSTGLQTPGTRLSVGATSGGTATGGTVNFNFTTHNPIAESESQTTNKALDRVVSLGLA